MLPPARNSRPNLGVHSPALEGSHIPLCKLEPHATSLDADVLESSGDMGVSKVRGPVQSPNSMALIVRTPTKEGPQIDGNGHIWPCVALLQGHHAFHENLPHFSGPCQ